MMPPTDARPKVSFGIIARRRIPELDRLAEALLGIEGPAEREVIIGVEAPGTTQPAESADGSGVRWIELPAHRGLGYNRNRVLDAARGDIIVGVDDDCVPKPGWLLSLLSGLEDASVDAVVGQVEIPAAGFVGDSISALGFPAGGRAGFETMFHVAENGSTRNISTLNYAARISVLREIGGFDEKLTYGGEDTELAYRLVRAGKEIVFVPSAVVVHPARTNLGEFTRWFFVRGRAKCQFAREVPVARYVEERLASYGKILRAHATDPKIFLIAPLLVASVLLQQTGFLVEWVLPTRRKGSV